MKVIKPQRVGVLFRPFERRREFFLSATGLLFFPFDSPDSLLTEVNLWKFSAAELGKEAVLDLGMPKENAEVLLTARAYPPGGPRPGCSVRVTIGSLDKTLYVVGDREWRRGEATDPRVFAEMDIAYENAFGGKKFAENPLGKGADVVAGEAGEVHPLPNVEDPKHPVASPNDRPSPAGFAAYDLMWPQRFRKIGTYDAKWLEERFPGFADDMDPTFFNTAPEDQQFAGRFSPKDAFRLENMHPEKSVLASRLPDRIVRCFLTLRGRETEGLVEVPLAADTVHLFPDAERGVVVFRGVIPIAEDDAADVIHAVVACEAPGKPRSVEHYQDVLKRRLDKKLGAIAALREGDLLPPREANVAPYPEASDVDEMTELVTRKGAIERNLRKRTLDQREKVRAELVSLGLRPEDHLPPPPEEAPPQPSEDELGDYAEAALALAEDQKAQAEKRRDDAIAGARRVCQENGLDFDKLVEEERKRSAGPPKFSAKEQLEHLEDMRTLSLNAGIGLEHVEARLADPNLKKKLEQAEVMLRDAYVKFAHHFPAAARLDGEAASALSAYVAKEAAAGKSLAGKDLTGANLAGLDLSGVDLRGAMLEAADLSRADLSGADLTDSVLTRADLTSANLRDAKLRGANLGGAKLSLAALVRADMTRAVLAGADLVNADVSDAIVEGADFMEAIFTNTKLDGIAAPGAIFLRCDLGGASFSGADLTKCNFVEVSVKGANFSGAKLESALFLTSNCDDTVFDGAAADQLRFVVGCSLEAASFRGASLRRANFRATNLRGADFTEATLDEADLSEGDLRDAVLVRAVARQALFIRTDLAGADARGANFLGAILQKARLARTKLRGANLFRADLLRVQVDGETDLTGAELTQVRFVDRRSAP